MKARLNLLFALSLVAFGSSICCWWSLRSQLHPTRERNQAIVRQHRGTITTDDLQPRPEWDHAETRPTAPFVQQPAVPGQPNSKPRTDFPALTEHRLGPSLLASSISDNQPTVPTLVAAADSRKLTIRQFGSDAMVNLSWALAEAYAKVNQNVRVEISGGGAGIGVAALINGTCDIADSARKLLPEEIEKAQAKLGRDLQEFPIGYDALIVCVHRDNPLEQISIAQLAQIYREGGRIDKWSDLGVKMPKNRDNIVRVSRQNNSGSYHFFREILIGKQADFKLGRSEE